MINVLQKKQVRAEPTNILTGVVISALKVNVAVSKPMDIIALPTREALPVQPSVSHDVNVRLDSCVMTNQEAQHTENVSPLVHASQYLQRLQLRL